MKSIGFNLEPFEKNNLLAIISSRPTVHGLETHLVDIYKQIEAFKPEVVVFDPFTDLMQVGSKWEVRSMLLRIIDYMKNNLITVVITALINFDNTEHELKVSSLVDNWVRFETVKTERNTETGVSIIKIRGMKHSRSEFILNFTDKGLEIKNFKNQPSLQDNTENIEQQKEQS